MIESIDIDLNEATIAKIQEEIVKSMRLSEASASLLAPYGSEDFNQSLGAAIFNEYLVQAVQLAIEDYKNSGEYHEKKAD